MRPGKAALLVALLSLPASMVSGQQVDLMAVGGTTTFVNNLHAAGGGLLHVHARGWGGMAMGTFGTGSEYRSHLYAGAATRRAVSLSGIDVSGFLGYGMYGEAGVTKIERQATGPFFGVMGTLSRGPLIASLVLSDLIGTYDGSDVTESYFFHVPRLSVGIGVGFGRR